MTVAAAVPVMLALTPVAGLVPCWQVLAGAGRCRGASMPVLVVALGRASGAQLHHSAQCLAGQMGAPQVHQATALGQQVAPRIGAPHFAADDVR